MTVNGSPPNDPSQADGPAHAGPERRVGPRPGAPRRRATDIVRHCREAQGLSRTEMAERLGVPDHIVALWEDPGYDGIDLAILHRVARAAGGHIEINFVPAAARPISSSA